MHINEVANIYGKAKGKRGEKSQNVSSLERLVGVGEMAFALMDSVSMKRMKRQEGKRRHNRTSFIVIILMYNM